jgi:DNA-binding NarL/FixJ family response regulator
MRQYAAPSVTVDDELTFQHREVIRLIANGEETKGIARALGLSVDQVKTRVHQLMIIFGARDRAHVVAKAMRAGILKPEQVLTVEEQFGAAVA